MTRTLSRRAVIQAVAGSSVLFGIGSTGAQAVRSDLHDAFAFVFPIYEFARTAWAQAAPSEQSPLHRFNQLAYRRTLADPANRNVTTPNVDTIYASARLDLSNGPVLVEIPTIRDRYFSVAFMDAFTDNFAYVGTRATNGDGGTFAIIGPTTPRTNVGGAQPIVAPTNDVWMLARVLVRGLDDLVEASAAQDRIRIVDAPEPSLPQIVPAGHPTPENLLAVANEWLARSPMLNHPIGKRARRFASVGLRSGATDAWQVLSAADQIAWNEAVSRALAQMTAGIALRGALEEGWRYPPPEIGAPGDDDWLRAAVALSGLGALEPKEAAYARCDQDILGTLLTGTERYRLTLPASIPVDAFWSVSIYQVETDGRLYFAPNALGRYAISDRISGFVRNAEGKVEIEIASQMPGTPNVNWLPCPPGAFALVFRAYIPRPAFLDGSWRIPGVRRVT
jgi:hypothetical protein